MWTRYIVHCIFCSFSCYMLWIPINTEHARYETRIFIMFNLPYMHQLDTACVNFFRYRLSAVVTIAPFSKCWISMSTDVKTTRPRSAEIPPPFPRNILMIVFIIRIMLDFSSLTIMCQVTNERHAVRNLHY